jgi:hypothetical membrane protein
MSSISSHFEADYTSRQIRILAVYGILAPVIYVAALVVGNLLDPSYSQVGKTVSELIETGAPNRLLLNGIFVVYNLFLIPFAEGLHKRLEKGVFSRLVTTALILAGILGVVWTIFFPLDQNGGTTSFTGMMHIIVGGFVVPLVFVIELGFWRQARLDGRWTHYGRFSLFLFLVTLVFGIATVVFVNSDIRGLLERITTGSLLLWIELVSLRLFRLSDRLSPR